MKSFWVYILKCADGSFYVGNTDDLERRIGEHQFGEWKTYTSTRRPVHLVFATEMPTRDEAMVRERQIKNWSRAKKDALINSDWKRLSFLARGTDRVQGR